MTGVDLKAGAMVIAAAQVPAALSALAVAGDVGADQALAVLRSLGFEVNDLDGSTGELVIDGFRGQLEGPADAALAALAPFVDDETILLWEDDNGTRWRYVIAGGQVTEQVPEELWRNAGDRSNRTGGVLAPLTITRDVTGFERWWAQTPNREDITEILGSLAEPDSDSVEYNLHSLMITIFQDTVDAARWLHVAGLGRGIAVSYLCLDVDPAFDGDGVLDGVKVVLGLYTGTPLAWLKVSVYVDHARRVLVPWAVGDPQAAVAEVVDIALDIINAEIADQDRFIFGARDVLAC